MRTLLRLGVGRTGVRITMTSLLLRSRCEGPNGSPRVPDDVAIRRRGFENVKVVSENAPHPTRDALTYFKISRRAAFAFSPPMLPR